MNRIGSIGWLAAAVAIAALGASAVPAMAQAPQLLAPAAATESADFDVYFPLRDRNIAERLANAQGRDDSPEYHKWLTPQEVAHRFGPTPQMIGAVTAELGRLGMTVTEHTGQRLHVQATAAAAAAGFGVRLWHARFSDGSKALLADRKLALPPALAGYRAVIPQFIAAPALHRHAHIFGPVKPNFSSPVGPYLAADLRQAYDFPSATAVDGSGARIGILIDNDRTQADLNADLALYFKDQLAPNSVPKLAIEPVVSSGGGGGFGNGPSPFANIPAEATLDVEQSSAMAVNANVVLYSLSDLTFVSVLAGLNQIVSDNSVDVVSMSFGASEFAFTLDQGQSLPLLDINHMLFVVGSLQGITFVAGSGDFGADFFGAIAPQYPSSDPLVTGVGGTNLITNHASGSNDSSYVSENAQPDLLDPAIGGIWASGGGASILFGQPDYQTLLMPRLFPFRFTPDLAMHMGGCLDIPGFFKLPCPTKRSSDFLILGGQTFLAVGTSASAPDFAGLVAIIITAAKERLGPLNTFIYQQAVRNPKAFHHAGIKGSNGVYRVAPPYDPVIGNGTVDARQLFGLTSLPAAGPVGTPGNP